MVGADHRRWTVVLGRADAPGEHIYTTWLSGATGQVLSDFLLGRGSLLRYLEARDYPAPRLVRTGTGEILGFHDGWCALVTHERGSPLVTPTLAHMRALGDVLGRLHTLGSEDISAPVASGWLYPVQALAEALYHLATSRETAPRAWKELLGGFHATLNTIRLSRLPRTLTHGNAFAGTALVAPDAQLALRLWHPAGDGVALLDLGRLLLGCHWDPEATTPQPIVPDPRRIDAVMEGYLARRLLVPVERERLLEAIRFSIAYGAAEHLSRAHTTGWTPQLERKLAVRQQWFAASAQIAASATAALG
jgi:Ser/Thr protein kinase RdoA (MazF antagonist)